MAFLSETGSGSGRATDHEDLLAKIIAAATSQHVSAVDIDTPGTGYLTNDIVSINSTTQAGIYLAAKFEVTSSAGAITALRIISSGAIGNRVASATIGAGGTGYAVGDLLEVQGGTTREKAIMKVDTVSGGVVTAVSTYKTGGAYSAAPSNPASTVGIGPSGFAGDDACTLNLTMTGLVGTNALALQGGSGTGGKVDITLTETGWTTLRHTQDKTINSVDEHVVMLKGDSGDRLNKPIIGFITWSFGSSPVRYGISCFGMRAHNSATAIHLQDGISPGINTSTGVLEDGGGNILCDEDELQEMDFWISVNDRRMFIANNNNVAAGTSTDSAEYIHAYLGYYTPFNIESEDPYPLLIGASGRSKNIDPSAASREISGIAECISNTTPALGGSGWWFYRNRDSSWVNIVNHGSSTATDTTMFPLGRNAAITSQASFAGSQQSLIQYYLAVGRSDRTSPVHYWMPAPGGTWVPIQLAICNRIGGTSFDDDDVAIGIPEGIYWVTSTNDSAGQITHFAEDYLIIGTDRYRVFGNHVHMSDRHQFIAVKEDI